MMDLNCQAYGRDNESKGRFNVCLFVEKRCLYSSNPHQWCPAFYPPWKHPDLGRPTLSLRLHTSDICVVVSASVRPGDDYIVKALSLQSFFTSSNFLTRSYQVSPRLCAHPDLAATMPLTSDLSLPADKFKASAISEKTAKLNEGLMKVTASGPKWWEVRPTHHPPSPSPPPIIHSPRQILSLPNPCQ